MLRSLPPATAVAIPPVPSRPDSVGVVNSFNGDDSTPAPSADTSTTDETVAATSATDLDLDRVTRSFDEIEASLRRLDDDNSTQGG